MSEVINGANGRKPIRILLVGRHEMILTALRMLIESQDGMRVIGEASDRNEAVSVTAMKQPDIILFDLHPGNEDGVDFIPDLHAAAKDARVLVLVGVSDPNANTRATLLGAVGVLSKQENAAVLIKALEKVSLGEAWIDRSTLASVLTELSRRNGGGEMQERCLSKIPLPHGPTLAGRKHIDTKEPFGATRNPNWRPLSTLIMDQDSRARLRSNSPAFARRNHRDARQ